MLTVSGKSPALVPSKSEHNLFFPLFTTTFITSTLIRQQDNYSLQYCLKCQSYLAPSIVKSSFSCHSTNYHLHYPLMILLAHFHCYFFSQTTTTLITS
uniref:Putative ovule protein n=1 Tax=Solanum chacoense TaxID=4108 RepID=A0A0V0HVX8_SOLCH